MKKNSVSTDNDSVHCPFCQYLENVYNLLPGQNVKISHKVGCQCENIEITYQTFTSDSLFQNLVSILLTNRDYFQNLTFTEAISEITWHLQRCNVSCQLSGLVHSLDFEIFATYVYVMNIQLSRM